MSVITAIEGGNFSGRTELLMRLSEQPPAAESPQFPNGRNAFLGVDVYNYLSGLMPTTRGELDVHRIDGSAREEPVDSLLQMVNWTQFGSRNPLTLSGGQQVVVTLATAIMATRDLLLIDCCFEQLSPEARRQTIAILKDLGRLAVKTVLADNRLREFASLVDVEPVRANASAQETAPFIRGTPFAYPSASHGLNLEELSFAYQRSQPVLDRLSYRFEPAQLYFLKGANGAGKTTLCKLLCGLYRPNGGHVADDKGNVLRPWERPGFVAAYHFQNPDLQLFSARVEDEIGNGEIEVAKSFGLEALGHSHPHDLPFVLRKRTALAAAIARRRPWLILDEPALGQDDRNAAVIADILSTLVAAGAGVIVVTHSEWFQGLIPGARLVCLDKGKLRDSARRT